MLRTKPFFLLLASLLLAAPLKASAAACCGGSVAAPALIAGDDKAQVTGAYIYQRISDDVGTDSLWRKRSERETSTTFRIDGAHIFNDQWQAGFSLPVVRRERSGRSSTGLGDVAASLGYEYLPDWDYNPWRPRGLGYLQLTMPSGKSINESDSPFQLDSRGRGFWAIGAGTLLTKIYGRWDILARAEVHKSFAKSFRNSQANGRLTPGLGGSMGVGNGYSVQAWRLGMDLNWTYEDAIAVSGSINSKGSPQRYAAMTVSASYDFQNDWMATASYSDQTILGHPVNTSLGRGATLIIQRRWPR